MMSNINPCIISLFCSTQRVYSFHSSSVGVTFRGHKKPAKVHTDRLFPLPARMNHYRVVVSLNQTIAEIFILWFSTEGATEKNQTRE